MSLLDDDNEAIKKASTTVKKKKKKTPGLNRFASLNKYSKVVDNYKTKSKAKSGDVTDKIEEPDYKKPATIKTPTIIGEHKVARSIIGVQKSTIKDAKKSTKRVHGSTVEDTEKSTPYVEESTKWTTKESTERIQNRVQTYDAPEVRCLTGQNKKLLDFMYDDCKRNGSLITNKFTNELLCNLMDVKPSTLKTLIYRLTKGEYLLRYKSKKGRGGWMSFSLPKNIFDQMVELDFSKVHASTPIHKSTHWSTEGGTERATTSPSKLDSKQEKNSNLTNYVLDFGIEDLNFEKLQEVKVYRKQIGDSIRNINHQEKIGALDRPLISKDDFQHYIDCFYTFCYSPTFSGVISNAGFFCKDIMVFQQTGSSQVIEHHQDMEDRAYEEYITKIKLKKESNDKIEDEAIRLSIADWSMQFTKEEFLKIIPLPSGFTYGSDAHNKLIYSYFVENEWPGIKASIRKKTTEEIEKEVKNIEAKVDIKDPEF